MRDYVHFFGNTGNKELIFSNILQPGGLYLFLNGMHIIFDPGPGTLSSYIKSYPNQIHTLDAVILSHIHFDHSNDVNIFIDGMTDEGKNKRGVILVPQEAIENDRTIKEYLMDFPEKILLAKECTEYIIGSIHVKTSIAHQHGVENYGYSFSKDSETILSIITDTKYFEGLAESYPKGGTLIVNVPYYMAPLGKKMKHLTLMDIPKIVATIQPKQIILSHFGSDIYKRNIKNCVRQLHDITGIKVMAAESDTKFML